MEARNTEVCQSALCLNDGEIAIFVIYGGAVVAAIIFALRPDHRPLIVASGLVAFSWVVSVLSYVRLEEPVRTILACAALSIVAPIFIAFALRSSIFLPLAALSLLTTVLHAAEIMIGENLWWSQFIANRFFEMSLVTIALLGVSLRGERLETLEDAALNAVDAD